MKIFVGGLPFKTGEQELSSLFEKYGEPKSVTVVIDRPTGRSKGYGFVEIDDDAGQQAINELDGSDFQGRRINVSIALNNGRNRS